MPCHPDFENPGVEYRGTDLWMLNDKLEDKELETQIEEMKKAGCGAFIARTFFGLKSDYPGENFMDRMKVIIVKAKKEGLKVFLQAGYMPGGVPDLPGKYTHRALTAIKSQEYKQEDGTVVFEADGYMYCIKLKSNYLDLLDKDAVKHYMKAAYTDIWERFEDEFGKTVISVWVDEPHFNPPELPWNEDFPSKFKNIWGYKIEENIPSLFFENGEYKKVRYHYWRTVLEMLKGAYFEEVRRWCREHNLKFSGHLMGEDALETQIGYTCSAMSLYKYMDIPGIDLLTGSLEWRSGYVGAFPGNKFLMTPLQCSSAAHQAGKTDVLCETFACSSQGITFSDQRYLWDYFSALGINHRCIHGIFYSMKGRRKRRYVAHISYQQPWWKEYSMFLDYSARISWLMRQGKPVADVLVIHPIESAYMEYNSLKCVLGNTSAFNNGAKRKEPLEIDRMNERFVRLLDFLIEAHNRFELGDEDTLAELGRITDDGMFHVGEMSYKAVVLPELTVIRESTLALLEKFLAKGSSVIILGSIPGMIEGRVDLRCFKLKGLIFVNGLSELKDVLAGLDQGGCLIEGPGNCKDIRIIERDIDQGKLVFLHNNNRNCGRNCFLSLKGFHMVEEWLPDTGSVKQISAHYDNNSTVINLSLFPGIGRILMFNKIKSLRMASEGRWKVHRKDPNVLLLEYCSYKKENCDYSEEFPTLAVQQILTKENYNGPLTLRYRFRANFIPEHIWLAAEDAYECSIKVNETDIPIGKIQGFYKDKFIGKINISGSLHQGENTVEVTRYFEPLRAASFHLGGLFQNLPGVELESLYLLGDFGVYGRSEMSDTGCIRFDREFTVDREKIEVGSELTTEGYPFFAGSIVLGTELDIDEINEGKVPVLKLEGFRACLGKIKINGKDAGKLSWEPYETEITGKIKKGRNVIEIELVNTLRNLMGPYHRPQGEPLHCWGEYPWTGEFDPHTVTEYKDWYCNRVPDTPAWTEAYMQLPFGVNSASIYFK